MKRTILIGLVLLVAGALIILPALTARADLAYVTFDVGEWPDYVITDLTPYTNGTVTASGNPGNGLQGRTTTENNCDVNGFTMVYVTLTFPSAETVTSWRADLQRVAAAGATDLGANATFFDVSDQQIGNISYGSIGYALNTWYTSVNSAYVFGVKKVKIGVSDCGYLPMYLLLDNIVVETGLPATPTNTSTPTATATLDPWLTGWMKPLRTGDQKSDDTAFHPGNTNHAGWGGAPYSGQNNLNIGFSNSAYANVYAVHDGEIDSVVALTGCEATLGWVPDGYCWIEWDTEIAGGQYFALWREAYLITESLPDGRFIKYLVYAPKVTDADTVTAGCLIGTSLPMKGFGDTDLGEGAVLIQGVESDTSTTWDLSAKLVTEPSGVACAVNPSANCPLVANPDFVTMTGWEPGFDPTDPDLPWPVGLGGMQLPGFAQQVLNLSGAAQYTIHVTFQLMFGSAYGQNFFVNLGTTEHQIVVDPNAGSMQERIFSAASYTADRPDGLYTLSVKGHTGVSQYIDVLFVCVTDANEKPPVPGGGCIVLDPNFSITGTESPWSTSGGASLGPGFAALPDTAFVEQAITLNPKDDDSEQEYTLSVDYRRAGVAAAGESVDIDWAFGALNGSLGAVTNQYLTTGTGSIAVVTTPVTDTLILTADGSDVDQVAYVERVCLTPVEGGVAPGYGAPGPFEASCRVCTYFPTGDFATDFNEYVHWLACRLTQIWDCALISLLMWIYQTGLNILTLFGYFRIWLGATIISLVTWGNGNMIVFSNWLGGQFHNLGITVENALVNVRSFTLITGGGAGIWDAIVAIANAISGMVTQLVQGIGTPIIALLQQIVDFFINALTAVFGIIGTLLTICFTFLATQASMLIGMLAGIINALYVAFNTASVAVPPGAPNCAVPDTLLYYPCLGFYVLDNTIFSGPVVYIFPIAMGLMAWRTLLWGMRKVKGVFQG